MAEEPAGEPLASTPRPRTTRRARKPAATAPIVAEDGASVDADQVTVHQGAVGRVEATQVSVAQGAIGAARAENVTLERSAVAAALGDQVQLRTSYARSILARQVQLDRSAARVVIAADVRTNQTAVMFLVARKVSGEVRVLLDWRGALAFGAAAGIVFALLRRATGRRT